MAKRKELDSRYFVSNIDISTCNSCSNCPCKIYNNGNKIVFGIGNINTDTIFILPNYNLTKDNNILDIISNYYTDITGRNIIEDCYITRCIKCDSNIDYDVQSLSLHYCIHILLYEINRIKPSKIIVLDKDMRYINLYVRNCVIHHVINPKVLYYDNELLKRTFVEQLTKAINDT